MITNIDPKIELNALKQEQILNFNLKTAITVLLISG